MKEVVIVQCARTATGSFGGSLAPLTAAEIGTVCAKEVISRAGIDGGQIDEVIIGNVLSSGQGQNVARQIAIHAGVPENIPAMTINKLCGSGLRTVSLAVQSILTGDSEVVLAGGCESMSNAPYVLKKARWGLRMGNDTVADSLLLDGLTDAFHNYHMGVTAENIADRWQISRQEQDAFALGSQQKAEKAIREGRFKDEIAPVMIPQKRGEAKVFDTDEYPRFGVDMDDLAKLKPAFKEGGTVTAGNSSGINDGAGMFLLMSKEKAHQLGVPYLAEIVSYGSAGVDPAIMGYGVVPAARKTLAKAGLCAADMDLVEANEAFAAQALCVIKELGISAERVNVNGGAIALGHPIGASGARILVTLVHEMKKRQARYGLAALCIGGGMGTAMVIKMAD